MAGFQGAWGKWICNRENGVLYYPQQKTVMEIRIMKRTFTLVEILVVVAIIGILAGMALGLTAYVSEKTARTSTQTTIKLVELALENFKSKYGAYPVLDSSGKPTILYLENIYFGDSSYKNTLWGCFNDVTADTATSAADTTASKRTAKIRGIRIQWDTGKNQYQVQDGWRQPLIYVYPGVVNTGSYDLISLGKDRCLGNDTTIIKPNATGDLPATVTRNLVSQTFDVDADDITNFKRE